MSNDWVKWSADMPAPTKGLYWVTKRSTSDAGNPNTVPRASVVDYWDGWQTHDEVLAYVPQKLPEPHMGPWPETPRRRQYKDSQGARP